MPRYRIRLTFAVSALVLALGAAVVGMAIRTESQNWQWVLHTREVLERLERTRYRLSAAQTDHRNYLLTASPDFLRRFEATGREAAAEIAELRALTGDNPSQQSAIDELARRADRLVATLRESAQRADGGHIVDVPALEGTRPLVDAVDSQLSLVRAEEERLLERRNRDVEQARGFTIAAVVGLAVLALLLMAY